MIRVFLALFIVVSIISTNANAQQSPSASGSDATGSGGSLAYTVGLVDYATLSSSAGTINLGVQQPYQVIANEKDFQILVFPNPAPTDVTVRILNPATDDLQIRVYDLMGRLLHEQDLQAGETNIPLTNYSPATYILQVRISQEIRTYKIVKTHNP